MMFDDEQQTTQPEEQNPEPQEGGEAE